MQAIEQLRQPKRRARIVCYLTPQEKEALLELKNKLDVSVSNIIRHCLLHTAKIKPNR